MHYHKIEELQKKNDSRIITWVKVHQAEQLRKNYNHYSIAKFQRH